MKNNIPYIACFGEVLWDVYADGKKPGGAPFNVAAHAHKLGLGAHLISKTGRDAYGKEIREAMREQGLSPTYTGSDYTFETGVVNVLLDAEGKPSYDIKMPVAWDYIHVEENHKTLVSEADAFVYGSLVCRTKKSRESLFYFAELSRLNICDLNIRQSFYDEKLIRELLEITHILKINDEEAELLRSLFDIEEADFYQKLSERFSLDLIIQTLGADGAEAFHQGKLHAATGVKTNLVDTVGSGDAFLAAFIRNYLHGENIASCLAKGCALGAYVAAKQGAVPEHPPKTVPSE